LTTAEGTGELHPEPSTQWREQKVVTVNCNAFLRLVLLNFPAVQMSGTKVAFSPRRATWLWLQTQADCVAGAAVATGQPCGKIYQSHNFF
jgi:hypothetical protein